ncbi:MAG: hypothetical protein HUU56_14835 [Bdellovibrionaceae bacterium]|nr:hypothetical protein [Pseudobdellovibrionaceae bacterium]
MKPSLILLFSLLNFSIKGWAAACCGGSSSIPTMILSDDKAQVSSSYSFSRVDIDSVDNEGYWHRWDQHITTETVKLLGSHLLNDLWQVGFGIPIIKRVREQESFTGLGDINLNVGYEFLPEWDYHPIKPKGLMFFQATVPTGKTKMESENGGLDSTGNGLWSVGIGLVLTKVVKKFDLQFSWDWHHSFEKKFSNSSFSGTLTPGNGQNLSLGLGYNLESFRFGHTIVWTSEDPIKVSSTDPNFESPGYKESFATGTVSLSYLASEEYSHTLSYADQTWYGTPQNTSLTKSINYLLQKRWGR